MKKLIYLFSLLLSTPIVLADSGSMMGYGMMGGVGSFGYSLLGVIYFALFSFVFSVIFWATHNWLNKGRKR